MTEIRFYHLQTRTLEQALPEILAKAVAGGRRVVVKMADGAAVERFNDLLWTCDPNGFLPHGGPKDGFAENQPVYLTSADERPNGADVLILTGGTDSAQMGDYDLCCEMFDGRDAAAVAAARTRWKAYMQGTYTLTYWQQNERGGWDKKT